MDNPPLRHPPPLQNVSQPLCGGSYHLCQCLLLFGCHNLLDSTFTTAVTRALHQRTVLLDWAIALL